MISDRESHLQLALQPDGCLHIATGRDWLRAFCGMPLKRYQPRWCLLYRFGSESNHCRECAAVLDRRAKFPAEPNEELKPVLERIGKLFALSESPNENEAAAALARANELLQKHNLTRAVIQDPSQQTAEKGASDSLGASVRPYKYILARAAACLHDVEWYRHARPRPGTDEAWRSTYDKYVVFVGLGPNVATALATYRYLLATAEAFCRAAEQQSRMDKGDYAQGFADRILARVQHHKRTAAADPDTAALIRVGSEIAHTAMRFEKEFFFSGGFSLGGGGAESTEAYQRGYRDGGGVDLHGARGGRLLTQG
jgi:hypothetical protein